MNRRSLPLVPLVLLTLCLSAGAVETSFDQRRAWTLLEKQLVLGPRYPGSPGHTAARWWIIGELAPLVDELTLQRFEYQPPFGEALTATNIIGLLNPEADTRVMLGAHWDTRRYADEDPEPARRGEPVPGANDGASGVAVLLELARVFAESPPEVGVLFVFFDLEDQGRIGGQEFCIGSERLAAAEALEFDYGVIVDLVGDAELNLHPEGHSLRGAPELVRRVWDIAAELGESAFIDEPRHTITDDHLPFLRRGRPVIDIIDFDFEHWHTVEDTAANCSPDSLGAVGRVVETLLRRAGSGGW